jgi:GTPase SAR1 family protein
MEIIKDKPFCMSIAAPRGSGKSFLINKWLDHTFTKDYDYIFILNPSAYLNHDYDKVKKTENVYIISDFSKDVISELFDRMYEVKEACIRREEDIKLGHEVIPLHCPRTLLILDDCIDSNVFSFRGTVDKIAERGRHVNLSVIISSQRISAISRSIRINSDIFIIFCPYQAHEFEQYVEQFVFRDQRKSIYEQMRCIFDVPYQFLFIDNLEKNMRKKLKTSNADDFLKNKFEIVQLQTHMVGERPFKSKRKKQHSSEDDEQPKKRRNNDDSF